MKLLSTALMVAWLLLRLLCAQDAAALDTTWQTLAPGVISQSDIRETSPSITQSGDSLVFARTKNWGDKVPYLAIRTGADAPWQVEKLPFADTLYNLAISPDGQTIFMKQYDSLNQEKVSRVFVVRRKAEGWTEPIEQTALFNLNAGYFCPLANGRLYMFARIPQPGIYYSDPGPDGRYGAPMWLSDAVGEAARTGFDVFMHPDEDQLLITLSFSEEEEAAGKGPDGFYHFRKTAAGWSDGEYLPLPYGWGATVTPGGQLIFVDAGDLQIMPLEELGLDW